MLNPDLQGISKWLEVLQYAQHKMTPLVEEDRYAK